MEYTEREARLIVREDVVRQREAAAREKLAEAERFYDAAQQILMATQNEAHRMLLDIQMGRYKP